MKKLLEAYRASPTLKNAQKVRDYNNKHPMAVVLFDEHDAAVIGNAVHQANTGH
jgi:hypothetical protein